MANTFEVKSLKEGAGKGNLVVSLELTESDAFVKLPKNIDLVVNKNDLIDALGLNVSAEDEKESSSKKAKKQDK